MNSFFQRANRRFVAALAVTAAVFVPLAIFGGSALANGSSASSAQYQYKVTVCHKTHSTKHTWHTIRISNTAVQAHLRHGDFVVTATAPCPPTGTVTTTTTHGHHGNPNNQSGTHPGKGNGGHDNGHHGK